MFRTRDFGWWSSSVRPQADGRGGLWCPRCRAPLGTFPSDSRCGSCGLDLRDVSSTPRATALAWLAVVLFLLGVVGFFWLLLG